LFTRRLLSEPDRREHLAEPTEDGFSEEQVTDLQQMFEVQSTGDNPSAISTQYDERALRWLPSIEQW
jgi:hypothetical protein